MLDPITTRRSSLLRLIAFAAFGLAFAACAETPDSTAVKVEIVKTESGYQMLRGGEPYVIKGAGLEFGDMSSFAAHGGNSVRNWTTKNDVETAQEYLDRAHANGLTVALCLTVGAEHWGFDYDDPDAIAKQLERLKGEVLKYKDHPALLVWIIGNELNFDYTNSKVYDAVNDISKMVHELDPNHPTTTTIAGVANQQKEITDISTRAPDVDFISFQVYGELAVLPNSIKKLKFEKPFFVTEWGAIGHWEMPKTNWGAPIEMTSSEKAKVILDGYQDRLAPLDGQLIGSHVFLWGQKQERTPTWFGLFTEDGEETEAVDMMHYLWNDAWPENRSPKLKSMRLDGKSAHQNVRLKAGESYNALVHLTDPDGDSLTYRWEVKPESDARQAGGDFEESIGNMDTLIANPLEKKIRITAPTQVGAYRLFAYAYDGNGHAAHANIPFYVDGNN